ncbi:hypothetical protein LTS18_010719, partial [Coniosporium uncinatum]
FPNQGAYATSPNATFGQSQYSAGYLPGQVSHAAYGNYNPAAQRFSGASSFQQQYQQANPYYFYTQGQNIQQGFAQQLGTQYGGYDRRMSLSPAHGQQAGFYGSSLQNSGRTAGPGVHNDGLHFGMPCSDSVHGK